MSTTSSHLPIMDIQSYTGLVHKDDMVPVPLPVPTPLVQRRLICLLNNAGFQEGQHDHNLQPIDREMAYHVDADAAASAAIKFTIPRSLETLGRPMRRLCTKRQCLDILLTVPYHLFLMYAADAIELLKPPDQGAPG